MSIERNYLGAWVITDIVSGELFTRVYMGYSKRDAIALFKKDAKRNGAN